MKRLGKNEKKVGHCIRRNEPGSPSDCMEQSFTAALRGTGAGVRINLCCIKPLEFYSCQGFSLL